MFALQSRHPDMTVIATPPVIESPCVKICAVDPASDLCTGCGRTLDEITRWYGMSSEERRRVMAELPARIEALRQAYLNRNKQG
jgi:predicted Fe-S protein YdhL (DUF1289 family)